MTFYISIYTYIWSTGDGHAPGWMTVQEKLGLETGSFGSQAQIVALMATLRHQLAWHVTPEKYILYNYTVMCYIFHGIS